MIKKISVCIALIVLAGFGVARAADDSEVYSARLTRLLTVSNQDASAEQVSALNEAREALRRFADEFPHSIYADDSLFVYSLVEFFGALMVPPRDIAGADQMIVLMDQMVRQYPDGKVDELTYTILKKELGEESVGGSFYMPYSCIVEYMQALEAGQTRDYKTAIEKYSRLKEKLAPIQDTGIAGEVYVPLYIAYMRSGRSRDAQALADEASAAYPDSSLGSTLAAIKDDEKNSKDNH